MQIPLQISLHGIAPSVALRDQIRKRAARLERFHDRIVSCRVVLERSGGRAQGGQFTARIDLKVPGGELAVTREHDEDLQVALRDAFDAARRRLEDHARIQRGTKKEAQLALRPDGGPPGRR